MIRRISTKWMLAVLVVVVGLFLGFASYVERKTTARLSGDVVAQYLLSTAANLAERLDAQLIERRRDAEDLASNALIGWFLAGDQEGDDVFERYVQDSFDQLVERSGVYDLMLAVDAEGQFQTSNSKDGQGRLLPASVLGTLTAHEFEREPWFQEAMERGFSLVDQHRSALLPDPAGSGPAGSDPADSESEGPASVKAGPPQPSDFHVLFASRVGPSEAHEEPVGVVCLLMNWKHVQEEVSSYGVRQLLAEDGSAGNGTGAGQLMAEDIYQSSYAWVWKSDANTILAHPMHELYGQRVSQPPIELPHLVAAARSGRFGMYPNYSFRGVQKRAAFKHCRSSEEDGFGWVVGVGVDLDDIVAPVRNQSRVVYSATAVALSIAILLTVVIARRTTRPILELRRHTERVAHGDLDARVSVRGHDELADLGRAFNDMTAELKESRAQLVRVEKDAAWREMARQVAHEIKNPLTPISLSVSLLRRAVREESPEQGAILERTLDLVERQVEQMRGIAKDFYAFAGEDKEPRPFDASAILSEVLELNAAWADQLGVRVEVESEGATLLGNPDEFRRALINLISNAMESMVDGGTLGVQLARHEGGVVIEISDTGPGISEEAEGRLFEPYFTTRSSGTGLGLAIVHRIVEDMGGSVVLANRPDGPGAIARIELKEHAL